MLCCQHVLSMHAFRWLPCGRNNPLKYLQGRAIHPQAIM